MKTRGVIAASDPHTAEAGARMLRQGGNAVDAVVAAKFAATVTELPLTSLAGGGACTWGSADAGYEVLDFFAATPGCGLETLPIRDFVPVSVDFGRTTQVFHIGKSAAAIPGELLGLLELHRRAGRLPLCQVLAPAVAWARDGFQVSAQIEMMTRAIAPIARHSSSVATLFRSNGRLPRAGERLANPLLGDFLHTLGQDRSTAAVARYWRSLVEHFGLAEGGLITEQDIAAYEPKVREPLVIPLGHYTVLSNPPPSAGGGLVGIGLRFAEEKGLGREAFLSTEHQLAIADVLTAVSDFRQGGYDNSLHADPEAIRACVKRGGTAAVIAPERSRLGEGNAYGATTHISVIDAEGLAAAMTTSNGEGCGHALPGLGIHVNNFLGEEDINPNGFHRFKPGSRMSTMMSPTIVLADDRPCLALGSGGSNRIRSAILQTLLNLLVYRRPLEEAVNAPRLHIEGRKLWFEDVSLDPSTTAVLLDTWPEAIRFDTPSMFFGGVNCAASSDGRLFGAGDRRRGGVVVIAEG